MKLYLSSYRLGNKVKELKKWINEINDNKILLIPDALNVFSDGERKQQSILSDVKSLEDLGFEVTILFLKNYLLESEKLKEDLKNFHSFFAIGGNTFVLRQVMKLSGFDDYLRELSYKEGYLYGGYSAGICLLAPNLKGLELVDNPNIDIYNLAPVWEGIGLIDYLPVPHFESNHPESESIKGVVEYLKNNGISYKTLHDGDVIIENTISTNRN